MHAIRSLFGSNAMAMEINADRAAKLRKLDDFRRRNPFCTASALQSIVRDIKENGAPELFTIKDMREARKLITAVETPHGPV